MRSSRMLMIVGAVVVIGAIIVGVIFWVTGQQTSTEPPVPVDGEGTVVPDVPQVQIVVAAQDLARGVRITEAMTRGEAPAVILKDWPEEEVPPGAITRLEDVIGRTTRVDAVRDLPILATMLVEDQSGSAASLKIPEGMVAYAVPVARYSSVAWALQPGDYVDMIVSLLVMDLDEEFQSTIPLQAGCVSPPEGEECKGGTMGRLEVLPNGWLVNLVPTDSQRPRLVTQLTIQNAAVLRVGDWPMFEEESFTVTEDSPSTDEEDADAVVAEEAAPSVPSLAPLTLAVTRQDAMVLEYAQLTGARITFVLRRAGDEALPTTNSVTLQYMMDRYNIEMPAKLPYGVEPRVNSLDTINRSTATTYQQSPEDEAAQ
ncbi:MAG: Flp pilus assembly protein CpaB [Chloroflexi bacterium]|nr:Flp pilus assembly protein CpaB [Chloroflexota bacterium]